MRSSVGVSEIRRRDANRDPPRSKMDVRISNGWNGSDLNRAMGNEGIHAEWLTPTANLVGIQIGSAGDRYGVEM